MELLATVIALADQDPDGWDQNCDLRDFDVRTRSSGSFQPLSRSFLERDPMLAGLRSRVDFEERIGKLIH